MPCSDAPKYYITSCCWSIPPYPTPSWDLWKSVINHHPQRCALRQPSHSPRQQMRAAILSAMPLTRLAEQGPQISPGPGRHCPLLSYIICIAILFGRSMFSASNHIEQISLHQVLHQTTYNTCRCSSTFTVRNPCLSIK